MKKRNELSLGQAIQEFLKLNDLDEKLLETEIYARWEELAGRAINLKTRKVTLDNKVLTVFLSSSVVRSELSMRRGAFLERINQRLSAEQKIRDIRFK